MKILKILSLCMLSKLSLAQSSNQYEDSIRQLSSQDHQKMMKAMGLVSLRPAVSGKDKTVNYEEAFANPFPILPELLRLNNGSEIKQASAWWTARRPELTAMFDREVYGSTPAHIPKVAWLAESVENDSVNGIAVIKKKLSGYVDNSTYPAITVRLELTITLPASSRKPVPVILELAWKPQPGNNNEPAWHQQVLSRGWGYAQLIPVSFQADNGAGLTQGIIGLCNKGNFRKPGDWGTLRAWAWGASRVMDYFEQDPLIDAKHIGIAGHSRYGKAALVAMAYDQRFAIAHISSSGEGGAKLHRRNYGEVVENVTAVNEYHWMAGNFLKYAGPLQWKDLPVDSHELIALCAPRPVFIGCGDKGDEWADPKGMFMALVAAGPVYKLLGKTDMGVTEFPTVGTSLIQGDLAFRQHSGGHSPDPNWPVFLEFAQRYFQ